MPTCRGCGAQIEFIKLQTGAVMPVDPIPEYVEDGSGDAVIVTTDGRVSKGRFSYVKSVGTMKGYRAHFATCPEAAKFRRRQSK